MSIQTNKDRLVEMAVGGRVSPPEVTLGMFDTPYTPNWDGVPGVMLGMMGIVYNCRVGDPAFGWEGDHVEPGVSISHPAGVHDFAMHYLTCIGNQVVVKSGLAKGAKGIITGEHGRLLADFEPETLEKLCVGDEILIKAKGRGLRFTKFPDIHVVNSSPELIEALDIRDLGGAIEIPVVTVIPSYMMGSGSELNSDYVDQDLMSGDRSELARLGLDNLRLGDLVAVPNTNHRFGRAFVQGMTTICIVMHGDSVLTGHGPGIQTLMTGSADQLRWRIDSTANLADLLEIGNYNGR
jgi:hypothetical protein